MSMKAAYDAIMACRADPSKLRKLEFLTQQKDNEDLRQFLIATYEPRINYFISEVEPKLGHSTAAVGQEFNLEVVDIVRQEIAGRLVTGGDARRFLANLYHDLDSDWGREMLQMMIERDVRAGFNVSTINSVWPGLLTDPPYMRCDLVSNVNIDSWPWVRGIFSEVKADGMFANISHHQLGGRVTIESRAGSPFPLDLFSGIVGDIKARIPAGNQVHGELLIENADGTILERQVGNGLLNKIRQGEVNALGEGQRIVFHAWDIIPLVEAKAKNKYKVAYSKRFGLLESLLKTDSNISVQLIEYKIVYSKKEAYAHYKECLLRKLEGTVIKHPDMIWEDTTSKYQIKLKLTFEMELLIKGFNPPLKKSSKNKDTFGSLQMESQCGRLKVGATGFTDKLRKELWEIRDKLIDKPATVKANGIMEPDMDEGRLFYSLFLPNFIEVRYDKTQADTLEEIFKIQENTINSI